MAFGVAQTAQIGALNQCRFPMEFAATRAMGARIGRLPVQLVLVFFATVEQTLDLGQLALVELRRRTATTILPGRQWILERQIVLGAIRRSDLQRFRERVPAT